MAKRIVDLRAFFLLQRIFTIDELKELNQTISTQDLIFYSTAKNEDPRIRQAAMLILAERQGEERKIIQSFSLIFDDKTEDPDIRRFAINLLSLQESEEVNQTILLAAKDYNPDIREVAVDVLKKEGKLQALKDSIVSE